MSKIALFYGGFISWLKSTDGVWFEPIKSYFGSLFDIVFSLYERK